ncbi:MAG: biliverdin-producing heme oxygenase [Salegentibacter sp.]|uniref:Heme oxygenase n=1 Tax=Salegentibacter flavus TaxID=287099 RepID=A0A1I5BJM8_9FLAO|nr:MULTISPECIES: biliverdin-producing heme oxygenase [Salegentibacter]MDR9457447.1 biliverdin-producing heme oxygenase [Salegentibacter sp.]SFN74923.1 heme oxygenase [Salegentibacter flavus]
MLTTLREATKQLHEEIEQDNLAAKIMSHEISLEEYKLLLLQNYIAYKITEEQISNHLDNWKSDKSLRLKKDLDSLNVDTSVLGDFKNRFSIKNKTEAIGATYVVEGSALGGMQISKELPYCQNLSEIEKPHFFTPERKSMEGWNIFLKGLRNSEFSEEEKHITAQKAQETFKFFAEVFKLELKEV